MKDIEARIIITLLTVSLFTIAALVEKRNSQHDRELADLRARVQKLEAQPAGKP